MGLINRLGEYDGKSTAVLEGIRAQVTPDEDLLLTLVDVLAHEDPNMAAGASWLLRAWVASGVSLGTAGVEQLADELTEINGDWARLHICQTVRSLTVPADRAAEFGDFLESCRGSERPFLRAWATDGLHHLALQHPSCAEAAEQAIAQAHADPAASVRARARRIVAGQ